MHEHRIAEVSGCYQEAANMVNEIICKMTARFAPDYQKAAGRKRPYARVLPACCKKGGKSLIDGKILHGQSSHLKTMVTNHVYKNGPASKAFKS